MPMNLLGQLEIMSKVFSGNQLLSAENPTSITPRTINRKVKSTEEISWSERVYEFISL
jgi:hypothetical protein